MSYQKPISLDLNIDRFWFPLTSFSLTRALAKKEMWGEYWAIWTSIHSAGMIVKLTQLIRRSRNCRVLLKSQKMRHKLAFILVEILPPLPRSY